MVQEISSQLKPELLGEFIDGFLDISPDLFAIASTNGYFLRLSPSWTRCLGWSLEELAAKPYLEFVHPDDRHRTADEALRLAQGQRVIKFINRYQHKDGTWRYLRWFTAHPAANGQVHAVAQDITETVMAEQELQFIGEQLQHSQKMESIGRLAGGIAHDFNNILTVISGHSENLLNRFVEFPEDLRNSVLKIRKAASRAADLTKGLLAFSRQQVLSPTPLDLRVQMIEAHSMLQRLIGEDIEVEVHAPEDLGLVYADQGQIFQILMNLAVNARDAMPAGGKLRFHFSLAELAQKDIPDDLAPGTYIVMEVSDTGVGMDLLTLERIFEPFFTTKEVGKGTGLGLSIVYGIVKQSRGHITVESVLNQGTKFRIYLPRYEEENVTSERKESLSEKVNRLLAYQ